MSAECGENGRTQILKHTLLLKGYWVQRVLSLSALSTQLSALLFLSACTIPMVPYRAVYEDPVNYVRLEVDDAVLPEWPPSAHAHPKTMRAEDVARILGGISVKEHQIWLQKWLQGEAPLTPAFRPEELALLSQQIAEALALVRPDERVTFYLSQPQTSIKRVITTGDYTSMALNCISFWGIGRSSTAFQLME